MTPTSPELTYTAFAAALTGLIWVPVVLNRFVERGVWGTLQNRDPDARVRSAWARRLADAHVNAVENLVVFAALAIAVHLAGLGTATTATAAAVYFWARLAHVLVYAAGIPVLRTLAFLAGFGAQAVLFLRLVGLV